MFITKTKSGIYYLYYNDENYRRQKVSTRARRKSDAYKFLQTFKVENAKKKAPMLFSTFMIQFFEYSRNNLMSSTLEIYQRTREIFLETIGDMLMERLTPYHWDKYVSLRLQKVSPVTVNIELRLCDRSQTKPIVGGSSRKIRLPCSLVAAFQRNFPNISPRKSLPHFNVR